MKGSAAEEPAIDGAGDLDLVIDGAGSCSARAGGGELAIEGAGDAPSKTCRPTIHGAGRASGCGGGGRPAASETDVASSTASSSTASSKQELLIEKAGTDQEPGSDSMST